MFTLALSAYATTYEVELAIPEDHPSVNLGIATTHPFGMRRAVHWDTGESDATLASTDSRVDCVVEDGWFHVAFEATASNWPTSWPVTAKCESGPDEVEISVVKMSAATDISKRSATIVSNTVTLTRPTESGVLHSYALPAASYTPGTYNSTIAGVKCIVAAIPGGGHAVRVQMNPSSGVGTGTCTLPKPGPDYVLSLNLSETSI